MYAVCLGSLILFRHDDATKAEFLAQGAANAMGLAIGVWTLKGMRIATKWPEERSIP